MRVLSRAVSGPTRYRTDTFWNVNDDRIRIDRSNLDQGGNPYAHAMVSNVYEYDILHRLVARENDKSRNTGTATSRVRTDYHYDPNTNCIAVELCASTSTTTTTSGFTPS